MLLARLGVTPPSLASPIAEKRARLREVK
jgi:hypothetical protein